MSENKAWSAWANKPVGERDAQAKAIADAMALRDAVEQILWLRPPDHQFYEPDSGHCPGAILIGEGNEFCAKYRHNTVPEMREYWRAAHFDARYPLCVATDSAVGLAKLCVKRGGMGLPDHVHYGELGPRYCAAREWVLMSEALSVGCNLWWLYCDFPKTADDFRYVDNYAYGQPYEAHVEILREVMRAASALSMPLCACHFAATASGTHEGRWSEMGSECEMWKWLLGENLVPAVMVTRTVIPDIGGDDPICISPKALGFIRALGFKGLIVTDCLAANAWKNPMHPYEAAKRAILAGADWLTPDARTDWGNLAAALCSHIMAGDIPEAKMREACARVVAFKLDWQYVERLNSPSAFGPLNPPVGDDGAFRLAGSVQGRRTVKHEQLLGDI